MARASGGVAAVIVEPVMMNIGVVVPEPGFLEGLREICTGEGALLIFDEVKTGSKLAAGGAAEYYGVKPDLVTIAKSFGGGSPIGAFGGSRAAMRTRSNPSRYSTPARTTPARPRWPHRLPR